ncbi:hypothetical protein EDB95_1931 [Dinghuibacter silviterrae]|uniref:YhhN-like protein n=2 Tax=Dinghuibacter silviterrae TaxID=1539049 RepID=A0A4R8DRR1_9BACT|nr:hypothetical protein EDB95_1931 [Dinghuibacter silviterrae]
MIFLVVSDLPVAVAAVAAAALYRKADTALRIFCGFVLFSAAIQALAMIMALRHHNNMVLLHIYTPVGFVLLVAFYRALLGGAVTKGVFSGLALLFTFFSIINTLFFQNIHTFNSYALTVESILIIIITLFTFFVSLSKSRVSLVTKSNLNAVGWINSGLLVYYTSTLLIFYLSNYMLKFYSLKFNMHAWMMHSISSMVMYSCFIVGLWKQLSSRFP